MSTDPYAAPKSFVSDAPGAADDAAFVAEGQRVAAGNGWDWIARGWKMFLGDPGMWIALFIVFVVLVGAVSLVPFAGSVATIVLGPVMTAGIVVICRNAENGDRLEIGQLFAGFRDRTGPLVAVGALYLAAMVAIFLAVFLVMGAGIGAAALLKGAGGDMRGMGAGAIAGMMVGMLLVLAALLPVMMAVWFAAPLVYFHDMAPVAAMKASFFGCLRNTLAFLLYGLVIMVLAVFASLPVMLGWLALGPTLAGSYYASYRDIYTRRA